MHADATVVNDNGIKTLLANCLITFPIKGNPVFSNGPESLPKNPHDCSISCNWAFDNFILAEESFANALKSLGPSVLVNKNLEGNYFHH